MGAGVAVGTGVAVDADEGIGVDAGKDAGASVAAAAGAAVPSWPFDPSCSRSVAAGAAGSAVAAAGATGSRGVVCVGQEQPQSASIRESITVIVLFFICFVFLLISFDNNSIHGFGSWMEHGLYLSFEPDSRYLSGLEGIRFAGILGTAGNDVRSFQQNDLCDGRFIGFLHDRFLHLLFF